MVARLLSALFQPAARFGPTGVWQAGRIGSGMAAGGLIVSARIEEGDKLATSDEDNSDMPPLVSESDSDRPFPVAESESESDTDVLPIWSLLPSSTPKGKGKGKNN